MDNVKKMWIVAAVVALCAACYWLGGRNAPAIDVHNDTDRTMERVEEQQQRVVDEITGGRAAIVDAANANERASAAVDRSQRATAEITRSFDTIQQKVAECRSLAERNADLFDRAATENSTRARSRTEDTEKN